MVGRIKLVSAKGRSEPRLHVVESELGLTSYHLRDAALPCVARAAQVWCPGRVGPAMRAWPCCSSPPRQGSNLGQMLGICWAYASEALSERAERTGFVFYVAGNNDVVRYIPAVEQDDLDAPIIYQDAEGKEAWRLSRQSEVGTCREGKVLETCM